MLSPSLGVPLSLDMASLSAVALCVTVLLGLMLIFTWVKERLSALAWWGGAYLLGGFAIALWMVEARISPPAPPGLPNAILFIACGMIWSAARVFHGRPVKWGSMIAGAVVWLYVNVLPVFGDWNFGRLILCAAIISVYTFLAVAELWRERRKTLVRRWPAIAVPFLHAGIFLLPIPLASLLFPQNSDTPGSGWVAAFGLEILLYMVANAFAVLSMTKERLIRIHKDAASTDQLTGLFNRRGFIEMAEQLAKRCVANRLPTTVLVFDLDHFKSINDRFGHQVGDDAIRIFAATMSANLRATDVLGRLGGEEFVALLPATLDEGLVAAERVRAAFMLTGADISGYHLNATVSIGAASGAPSAIDVESLIRQADKALYQSKSGGRNRVTAAPEFALAS